MTGLRLLVVGCLLSLTFGAAPTALADTGPDAKPAAPGPAPKAPDGKSPDGKSPDIKSPEGKSADGKSTNAGKPPGGAASKDGSKDAGNAAGKDKVADRSDDGPDKAYKQIVRLSYNPGTDALTVIVAQERGFFRREGLIVSAIPVTAQRAIVAALASGAADFATGSQAWLIDMAQTDLPIKVVALNGYERKMEFVVPTWEQGIKKVSDLKGKTILVLQGTHNFDSVPELFKILLFNRVRLSDVTVAFFPLSQLGSVFTDNRRIQDVMRKRKIAAFFGYKEYTDYYVKQKRARVLMANEEIRKLLGRNGPRPLFANTRLIEQQPETVQRFVNAWVAAQDYIQNNREDATRLLRLYLLRQYGITLTEETAREHVDMIRYDRVAWSPQDITETNINAKMISRGRNILFSGIKDPKKRPFQKAPEVDKFIDNSFVEKATAKLAKDKEEEAKRRADAKKPQGTPKDDAAPKKNKAGGDSTTTTKGAPRSN